MSALNEAILAPIYRHFDMYSQDGLITAHNHDFMKDPRFITAYERGIQSVSEDKVLDYRIHWRLHVCLWAASHAIQLTGSFVECGVNYGFFSSAVMKYLDWNSRNVQFYLFDTFCGVDESLLTEEEIALGRLAQSNKTYTDCYMQAKQNFTEFRNVTLTKGSVPSTLHNVEIESVSYLAIDMNCAEPEVEAAKFFWPKLVAGGVVLLDDYAYMGYEPQKKAFDQFAMEREISILSLPTGQGLIIK